MLREIAEKKAVYDFANQLDNDLVSLAYYGMEKNSLSEDGIGYIKGFCKNSEFVNAFRNETLYKNSRKCLLYRILLKIKAYWAIRALANLVAKRRQKV